MKTEKSGTEALIFQAGIASDVEEKIICTSYLINAHGNDLAWEKAVDTFAKHKAIGKGTKLCKQLLAAMPKRVISRTSHRTVKRSANGWAR